MKKIIFNTIVLIVATINMLLSCSKQNAFSECETKFIAGFYFLKTTPSDIRYLDNGIVNVDSVRKEILCMIKNDPKNFDNYYWKSKMHILLEEYDSVVKVMENVDFKLEVHDQYLADTYIGLGYEFLQDNVKAKEQYTKARNTLSNFTPKESINEDINNYLLNNRPNLLKESMIALVANETNDTLREMYLEKIQSIPINQSRKDILIYISIEMY